MSLLTEEGGKVDYARMMDPNAPTAERVEFTMKGDRAVVKYNFFKMAFGRQGLDFDL